MNTVRNFLNTIVRNTKVLYTLVALVAIGGFVILWGIFGAGDIFAPERSVEQVVRDRSAQVIKDMDINACDQFDQIVDGVNYRTVCRNNIYWNRAIAEGDFATCDQLDGVLMTAIDCQNQVLQKKIASGGQLAICDTMPVALREQCVFLYWGERAQQDVSACKNIADQRAVATCEGASLYGAASRGDEPVCSRYTSDLVSADCDAYVKKQCNRISDPILQTACL